MTHPTTLIVLVNDADELGEMGKKKKTVYKITSKSI